MKLKLLKYSFVKRLMSVLVYISVMFLLSAGLVWAEEIQLEAEDANLNAAHVEAVTIYGEYTGTGYVVYDNLLGSYIEWTVNANESDIYNLRFKYAFETDENCPLEFKINGSIVDMSLDFLQTDTWNYVDVSHTLNSGDNTVRLTTIGLVGVKIDHLVAVLPESTPAPTTTPAPTGAPHPLP